MTDSALTDAQRAVLRLYFNLPESRGFVIAGGAALVAVGLSERPTQDLDLFAPHSSIPKAGAALERAVLSAGWSVERVHEAETFLRLIIRLGADEQTMVDLAQDSGPLSAATVTAFGPTYPPRELSARKLLALFGRAELRDFVDVDRVTNTYSEDELLELAGILDEGFSASVLAQMLGGLNRFTDDQIAAYGVEPDRIRRRFRQWAERLTDSD